MRAAGFIVLACLTGVLTLAPGSAVPAAAEFATKLIVAVSDSPDPAASGGPVVYAVTVRVDGSTKAHNVMVTMPVPADTVFVKCTMALTEGAPSIPCIPGLVNGTVTASLGNIPAWKRPRVSLTLKMPTVVATKQVVLTADADSTDATDDKNSATTTVLPPGAFVTYLPSDRIGPIACGDTLSVDMFGSDTIARLSGGLGCTSGPYGLKITASGKTLDLNRFKIVGVAALGNVGILVSNAANVTIIGGSTGGNSGIEFFDWCVKDEGKSVRLIVTSLRCFRARTAGFDITSKKVLITGVLVDRVVGTATTTAEPPGGVGIRTRKDKAHIKDSIVRRTGTVGIWITGTDSNGDGVVARIDGNTSTMRVENSMGIGLLLDGGPHSVKDVYVQGDGSTGVNKDGVVVGPTGMDNHLDGIVVKQHGGNGFVVNGIGTDLSRSGVDGVGLDGFLVAGADSVLSGNTVKGARHGYVITGLNADLESNGAEDLDGDGFAVNGDGAVLAGNSATGSGGRGFVIAGGTGALEVNAAEGNDGHGFLITGGALTIKGNKAKKNGAAGFFISGTDSQLNTNAAEQNASSEWVIGAGNFDDGGNKRNGATFSFTSAGGTFD